MLRNKIRNNETPQNQFQNFALCLKRVPTL